jgi:hypothetical protein
MASVEGAHDQNWPPELDVEAICVSLSAMAGRDQGDTGLLYIQLPNTMIRNPSLQGEATSITCAKKLECKIHRTNNQTELVLVVVCPAA